MSHASAVGAAPNPRLRVALRNAKRGRFVRRPGEGSNEASCDPDTIEQWWAESPDASPRFCTGTGFVIVGGSGPNGKRTPRAGVKGDGGPATTPRTDGLLALFSAAPQRAAVEVKAAREMRAVGDQPPRQVTSKRTAPRARYEKPFFSCTRIVRACRARDLTPWHKLVWEEHRVLANDSQGAFISAHGLGDRVAMSQATVERVRRDLKRWGLLSKSDGRSGSTDHWFPQLPIPYPHARRINDDDCYHYADLLARHITSLNSEGGQHSTEEDAEDADGPPSHREGGSPMNDHGNADTSRRAR